MVNYIVKERGADGFTGCRSFDCPAVRAVVFVLQEGKSERRTWCKGKEGGLWDIRSYQQGASINGCSRTKHSSCGEAP
jgi:hypothetical protein